MTQRIREAMKVRGAPLLSGVVVVADETWIGGEPKNRHASKRRRMRPRVGQGDVARATRIRHRFCLWLGLHRALSRGPGRVWRTLAAAIAEQAELRRITLWTDSATAYNRLNKHVARHEKVNHSEGEYVKRGAGTNKAELRFTAQAVAGRHPPPRL